MAGPAPRIRIVWFKRDLRIADHAPLQSAAESGDLVLPLYILEPEFAQHPDHAGRQARFLAGALASLDRDLTRLGQPLCLRRGSAIPALEALIQSLPVPVAALHSHQETGPLWTYARDRAIARWAKARGLPWIQHPNAGVIRPSPSRDDWAGLRQSRMARAPLPPPAALRPIPGLDPGPLPEPEEIHPGPDPCPGLQAPGREAAEALLDSFLSHRGRPYRRAMSSPLSAAKGCSRLSPHLALGTLSSHQVLARIRQRLEPETPEPGWRAALSSFQSRLAWRDHFMQKLEDQPDYETTPLHPLMADLHPEDAGTEMRLQAFAEGRTGLPFVDACIRCLQATGWINFRMRAMLVSLACHHGHLPWRRVGQILGRWFTDYEAGIHYPQLQMQAGLTGINTLRLYSPYKQSLDQDPDGTFIARWVPELAALPLPFRHHPQETPPLIAAAHPEIRAYPAVFADLTEALRLTRTRIAGRRHHPEFQPLAEAIRLKHASRGRLR